MERLHLPNLDRSARFIGRGLLRLFNTHQLASHGDNFVNERQFVPFEQLSMWDDMGNYTNFYDGDDLSNWPAYTPPSLGDVEAPNGWGQ